MPGIEQLFEQNREWSAEMTREDPEYFAGLAKLQKPRYLWIGCSDSRVPANQIVGLRPGEVFVHRNIANLVVHSDMNCLSVIEYAVAVLKVTDVLVCGHYGCGGVKAALGDRAVGLIDNWLRHLRDLRDKHADELSQVVGEENRVARLCELNVIEQVKNVASTSIVQNAWASGQELAVHGVVYGLEDGLLKDLHTVANTPADLREGYRLAMA